MLRRGDIVVERVTGNRAMVIHVANTEEATCRFGDGRLEDRFTFELDTPPTPFLQSIWSLLSWPFQNGTRERQPTSTVSGASRQRFARQSGASSS